MKIFFDTNVLIDVATRVDRYPHSFKLVNDLLESDDFSLWVSAITLNNIDYIVSKLQSREKARQLLDLIDEYFSIIPFRKSTFLKAISTKDNDFEDQIQIFSAEELCMDYIITRNVDDFANSTIPVLTPTDFLKKWDAGEFDSSTQVPFLDLKAQHHQIYNEIDDRFTDIIANTGFILGKHVDEFEAGFAKLQDAEFSIGVSSGTDALHIALLALDIKYGDRVIVPVNTFIATAEPLSLIGAVPVFVDCDSYYNMDTAKVREILENSGSEGENGKIKAIIPVHLYGQPAQMEEIMAIAEEFNVKVVEDCCQAHLAELNGKKVGNFSSFGCYSFYPGKNLGAYGEAGALTTNDEALYKRAKMIRQHGEIKRYHHEVIGHNYRMSALQGAALAAKLKFIKEWTEKRQINAKLYNELLSGVQGIETPEEITGVSCVNHLYVIQADDRDGLQLFLQENGVASGLHYPVPLHLQEAYRDLGYKKGDFPVAENAAGRILSLPMYPELTENQINYVCNKIKEFKN